MTIASKLVSQELPADHPFAYVDNPRRYNTLPDGWRSLTQKEFAQSSFFTYSPEWFDYIQAVVPGMGPTFQGIRLFYMHDRTGYAIVADYWKGKVYAFAFGCDHEWGGTLTPQEDAARPRGRCLHTEKCKKCGYVWSYDSSD